MATAIMLPMATRAIVPGATVELLDVGMGLLVLFLGNIDWTCEPLLLWSSDTLTQYWQSGKGAILYSDWAGGMRYWESCWR